MTNVEQVERQVKCLNTDELRVFRNWFAQFDSEAWEGQIEADSKSGALSSLADLALNDHIAGRSTTV